MKTTESIHSYNSNSLCFRDTIHTRILYVGDHFITCDDNARCKLSKGCQAVPSQNAEFSYIDYSVVPQARRASSESY